MAVYAAVIVQYFDSDDDQDPTHTDEWARGMAIATKNFTRETAAQTALVARGTAAERTSWGGVFLVEFDGRTSTIEGWHMSDQGTVLDGLPEAANVPVDPGEPVDPGPPDPALPAWRPWSGVNADLYQPGDEVSHNGTGWRSTAANNHWEPGVFGWEPI